MSRKLTLVVEIQDHEEARWIWGHMLSRDPINGVIIRTIGEGDLLEAVEQTIRDTLNSFREEDE